MNRRTLLTGTAWAAPVIIAATTAPAYATSTPPALHLNPRANRSRRHSHGAGTWDYHLDPGTVGVTSVFIAGHVATWDATRKRWTVAMLPITTPRTVTVSVLVEDGRHWSGEVRFS